MNTYLALFMAATLASLVITPFIRRLCERLKLLDYPRDSRRLHSKGIPRLGGIAIFLAIILALSILPFVDNLLTEELQRHLPQIFLTLIPAALVLSLGIYDDLRGANATLKFVALGLIAVLFYAMGGRIDALSIPFLGSVHLPSTISFLLTVFWLVGIANAFNLIDGLDGLASGAALFSSTVILAISIAQGQPVMIVFSLVLCGALAGFLRYNFNPASIFLGDSGALFIGFTLAALSVLEAQKATTAVAIVIPLLAFGLPVVDTTVTVARRVISRKPLFEGDREHIHHMLLARGWTQQKTALVLYSVCAAFGLMALVFSKSGPRMIGLGLFVLGVITIIVLGHLRYHELDELRAGVRRTVGDRRARVANNIRVRRAGLALSRAITLNEVLAAMAAMLEFEEFGYAELVVGVRGQQEVNRLLFDTIVQTDPQQRFEFINGKILWSWKRPEVDEERMAASADYWRFRLPLADQEAEWGWMTFYRSLDGPPMLVDMNYLSGFLRVNLTEAVKRILVSLNQPVPSPEAPNKAMTMAVGKASG